MKDFKNDFEILVERKKKGFPNFSKKVFRKLKYSCLRLAEGFKNISEI